MVFTDVTKCETENIPIAYHCHMKLDLLHVNLCIMNSVCCHYRIYTTMLSVESLFLQFALINCIIPITNIIIRYWQKGSVLCGCEDIYSQAIGVLKIYRKFNCRVVK